MSLLKNILSEVGEEVVEEVVERLFGDYIAYFGMAVILGFCALIFFAVTGYQSLNG